MRFTVPARDYDGTIAPEGNVDDETASPRARPELPVVSARSSPVTSCHF